MSVRPPAKASGEYAVNKGPHSPGSAVLPRELPPPTWITVADTTAHPAEYNGSFHAQPLKLSILMAAYNEERTITRVIDEILSTECPCEMELIVVDDGSTDTTPMLLSRIDDSRVIRLRHPVNQGKGAALLSAASLATGTYVLPFDADLEYAPEDISRVLEPILKGRCEVVYGVRLLGCNTVYQTYLYALGNQLLTRLANVLFNARLTDLHTCLKLIPLVTLKSLDLHEKGFGLDSEITAGLLCRGVRPFEVPISYYGRSHAEGKKITWRDAISCARILLRVRLRVPPRQQKSGHDRLGELGEGDRARVLRRADDPDNFRSQVPGRARL